MGELDWDDGLIAAVYKGCAVVFAAVCVQPMCFLSVMTVVGDCMLPEILGKVACCSKHMRLLLAPFLEAKMQDASEMHRMAVRFFPTMIALPADRRPEYYLHIISFATMYLPDDQEIHRRVGNLLMGGRDSDAIGIVFSAIRSFNGRTVVLRSIKQWMRRYPTVRERGTDLRNRIYELTFRYVYITADAPEWESLIHELRI